MGKSDYYAKGQWNFYCDLCGAKVKSSDALKTWNNLYVCRHHKEVRNPQDFVRGVKDSVAPPWTRSQPPDTFVTSDYQLLQEDGFSILQEADAFGDCYPILRT